MLGEEPEEVEVPEWYLLVRAARYLGVEPWALENQPTYWMNRALTAESAEQRAEAILQREANSKRKGGKS